MEKYKHIEEMETIMDNHDNKLKDLGQALDYLLNNFDDYKKLLDYYHSDQRQQDLRDDDEGLIDKNLKRGVLSEDAIYDMISNYYSLSVKMLELSTAYFKAN